MRPAIVLALLVLALGLRVAIGEPPGGSFDDRFESAEAKLEALSRNIEEDLERTGNR